MRCRSCRGCRGCSSSISHQQRGATRERGSAEASSQQGACCTWGQRGLQAVAPGAASSTPRRGHREHSRTLPLQHSGEQGAGQLQCSAGSCSFASGNCSSSHSSSSARQSRQSRQQGLRLEPAGMQAAQSMQQGQGCTDLHAARAEQHQRRIPWQHQARIWSFSEAQCCQQGRAPPEPGGAGLLCSALL